MRRRRFGWLLIGLLALAPAGARGGPPHRGGPPGPPGERGGGPGRGWRRLLPRERLLVEDNGRPLFEVYRDGANPWSTTIVEALPDIWRRVTGFLGSRTGPTTVVLFADDAAYDRFYEALSGEAAGEDNLGAANERLMLLARHEDWAAELDDADRAAIRAAAAHEFCHVVVERSLGPASLSPWFAEGLARYVELFFDDAARAHNETVILDAWRADQLLPLADLCVEATYDAEATALAAYEHGLSLVRYLIERHGRAGVLRVLARTARAGDFADGLRQALRRTPEEVYAGWRAAIEAHAEAL